jgi:hypothetical protein
MATRRLSWTLSSLATPTLVIASWSIIATAQSALPAGCNPSLIGASAGLPHRYQARAGYCDGTVGNPHRADAVLVSLTVGQIAFGASNRVTVRPVGSGNLRLWLRGVDVRRGRSYRLDGTVAPGGLAIDLAAAAIPNQVSAATLGLRAWTGPDGAGHHFPLLAGGDPNADVVATFRIDQRPVAVRGGICEGSNCIRVPVRGNYETEGAVVHIVVPRENRARQVQVRLAVQFVGNRRGGESINLTVPAR